MNGAIACVVLDDDSIDHVLSSILDMFRSSSRTLDITTCLRFQVSRQIRYKKSTMVLVFDEALFILSVDQNHLERRFGEYLIEYCFFFLYQIEYYLFLFLVLSYVIQSIDIFCQVLILFPFPLEKKSISEFHIFPGYLFFSSHQPAMLRLDPAPIC